MRHNIVFSGFEIKRAWCTLCPAPRWAARRQGHYALRLSGPSMWFVSTILRFFFCLFFQYGTSDGPRQWCRFYVKHNPDIYFLPHLSTITQTKDGNKTVHFAKFIACQDPVGCRVEHVTRMCLDLWALRSNIRFWCIVLHASLLLLILSFRWLML